MLRDGQLARGVAASAMTSEKANLLVFSHLRWDFVFQRPQHLLSRAAAERRVYFWEEALPLPDESGEPYLDVQQKQPNLWVARPYLPVSLEGQAREEFKAGLLRGFMAQQGIERFLLWYYTPLALDFTTSARPGRRSSTTAWTSCRLFRSAPIRQPRPARDSNCCAGGRRVHGRPQPVRGQAQRSTPTSILFPSSVDVGHFA
jgi:hypothetical protein